MVDNRYSSNAGAKTNTSTHQSDCGATRQIIEEVLPKKARDIMRVGIKTVDSAATVYEVVRILVERKITGVPVVEDTNLVGVITEKDILNLIFRTGCQLGPVGDHMTTRITTFDEEDSVADVLTCLLKNPFRRVPILRDGKLAGVVSRTDLIRAYMETFSVSPSGQTASSVAEGLMAREVMTSGLLTTRPHAPILEAMGILVANGITGLLVVDDHMNLVGIVSEKDLLTLLHDPCARSCQVGDLMSRDVTTFEAEADVFDVCECLANSRFRRVPVVERGKLVGIISRSDLIMFILKNPSVITQGKMVGAG